MNNEFLDYYEILEVHNKASAEVIKNAYRTLAKKYHPDIAGCSDGNSTKMMAVLNEAFDVLSDANKRDAYDRQWNKQQTTRNNDQQSRKPPEQTYYDSKDEATLNRIDSLCNCILDQLNKNIEHKNDVGTISYNKNVCDNALAEFTQIIPHEMEGLDKSSPAYRIAEVLVCLTLWRLGTCYTWANEFSTATTLLKQALVYAKPADDFYSRLEKAAFDVTRSAEIMKQRTQASKKNFNYWVALIAVIFVVNACSSIISKPSLPTQSNPPTDSSSERAMPKQPIQQQPPSPTPPPAIPTPIPLIPKANVVTQYVPKQPQYNTAGYGEIIVDNSQNDFPVFVRIWNIDDIPKAVRAITIRQGDKFTAKAFDPGRYEIRYATIYENQKANSASKSKPFIMDEKQEKDGISYSIYSLTLYKVRGGNATTYSIPMTEL